MGARGGGWSEEASGPQREGSKLVAEVNELCKQQSGPQRMKSVKKSKMKNIQAMHVV